MITASEIFSDVRSLLDDDGSNRYSEVADLVPALNNAIDKLVTIFNAAFEAKKISPESLRELLYTVIIPVTGTTTKKANVTTLSASLWTILGVDPDPTVTGSPDVLNETRNRWATRSSLTAWNDSQSDPFSPGTSISILADLIRPSYIGPGHYGGDSSIYIMIRPGSVFTTDKVAIWYLKNPSRAVTGASQIEFPKSIHTLLVEYVLNCLSLQHGPESKYGPVTNKDITTLVSLMI